MSLANGLKDTEVEAFLAGQFNDSVFVPLSNVDEIDQRVVNVDGEDVTCTELTLAGGKKAYVEMPQEQFSQKYTGFRAA